MTNPSKRRSTSLLVLVVTLVVAFFASPSSSFAQATAPAPLVGIAAEDGEPFTLALRVGWWHAALGVADSRFRTVVDGAGPDALGRELGFLSPSSNGVAIDVAAYVPNHWFGGRLFLGVGWLDRDAAVSPDLADARPEGTIAVQFAAGPSAAVEIGPAVFHVSTLFGYRTVNARFEGLDEVTMTDCSGRFGCRSFRDNPTTFANTFVVQFAGGVDLPIFETSAGSFGLGAIGTIDFLPEPRHQAIVHASWWWGRR